MLTLIIGVTVVALIAWFLTDRVIYKGDASVIANNMVHKSTTHKTVMVVPHNATFTDGDILVATVTNAKAAAIAASTISTHQIVVRRRIFGKPRVTRIS